VTECRSYGCTDDVEWVVRFAAGGTVRGYCTADYHRMRHHDYLRVDHAHRVPEGEQRTLAEVSD